MAYFSRFTQRAQNALVTAQVEATSMGRSYIGTEHLLLGILANPGAAASIFGDITYDAARNVILELLGMGTSSTNVETMSYSPRTKRVLELAARKAHALKQEFIGTEHILIALMSEREGVAAHVLEKLGLNLRVAREELIRSISQSGQGAPNTAESSDDASHKDTPMLNQYTRDLTKAAQAGELDPVIGRAQEIERIVQILSRRTKNNPVLIGEPGVGKSAIAEGLAQLIIEGSIPGILRDRRVVALDLPGMVAGTKFRGEFEERLKKTMAEIRSCGNIILFIDELHTIVGAGGAEGAIDAASILKPLLARGEMQCIGATTLSEYHKHIEKDAALARRFQPVIVGEPTREEAISILLGLRDRYEAHHGVRITEEAIRAAVTLSDRYLSDRFLPDKAIDLVDEAASRVRIQSFTAPPEMKEQQARIADLGKETEEAVAHEDFEKAARLRDARKKLSDDMTRRQTDWENQCNAQKQPVTAEDIAQVVSLWTGVPVTRMTQDETTRLLQLETILHQRVVGQEEAVRAVSRAVRRARAGLKDPRRPIGSFLFLGPTGVGKTELCKALAEALFGEEDSLIRMDMSEYMEKHTVSRLFGAPPGYVGYGEGGQLTEKVRRKPYAVVLFDEIEKAHPDVLNTLLQILEDGRMTDGEGRTIDFKNTVIVMTSNVGADLIRRQKSLGFGSTNQSPEKDYAAMRDTVLEEVRRTLRPEFINRIDETIVFHALTQENIESIARLLLDSLSNRLQERDLVLTADEQAIRLLAREGFDPQLGARPLRRAIQRMVEYALSEELLSGQIHLGSRVHMTTDAQGDALAFQELPKTPLLEEPC